MMYEWLRALHIISVIAWMAGMLMLPRLMVYWIEGERGGEVAQTMEVAVQRLRKIILTPTLILSWVFGITLIAVQWPSILAMPWLWLKLVAVIGISGMHGYFVALVRRIGTDLEPNPKTLRMLNEVPFVFAILAVIAVVIQPFV